MIYVIATITLEPGKRHAFLAEFAKIVPVVRAETGCIEYTPTIDADTAMPGQNLLGPDRVAVIEKWQSADALKAHDTSAHMQAFRSRVSDYVRARELRMLTTV